MTKKSAKELIVDAIGEHNEIVTAKAISKAAQWKKAYQDSIRMAVDASKQVDVLTSLSDKPIDKKFVTQKKKSSHGVAVIAPASDWHVEERVEFDSVNGKNSFDLTEAAARIRRFYSKVLELIEWQNHLAPVVELWHPLLGDLMSGYIHEELMETNSLSPVEACLFLQDAIHSGLQLWLKETTIPIVVPTCVGNHGRTTQKMRVKTSHRNSYEWLLYSTLAKQYTKYGRVFWQVGAGYHNIQEIQGRRVRFHHGDAMRFQGGTGGITIPVNRAISEWDKSEPADFDIFGHWHTFCWSYPKWVSCGSLMGYSEYSLKKVRAGFQHPTQAFIVLDRNYGITQAVPIFLTKAGEK